MTPIELYHYQCQTGVLSANTQQAEVMAILEQIYTQLQQQEIKQRSWLGKISQKIKPIAPVTGLYLWGSVGVGKTHLIDLFYQCLPIKKIRFHFHQFMQFIHRELTQHQGEKNPLRKIGQQLAAQYQVICFDEFFVSNIADAMVLAELLASLFAHGLCLVATSNVPPDQLYQDGIQRESFLPAIDTIKKHTQTYRLTARQDYRLRHLQTAGVYYTPLDNQAQQHMEKSFHLFADENFSTNPIVLCHRPVRIIKQSGKTIWFDFLDICGIPRCQTDFLELAKQYRTLMISNLRVIKPQEDNLITSFINLIDVMYDAHIRLIISAESTLENLYPQGRLQFEFQRTKSRLVEMQSVDYVDPDNTGRYLTTL